MDLNQQGKLNIVSINTSDAGGGAERIASDLHVELGRRGHETSMFVYRKRSGLPQVHELRKQIPQSFWRGTVSSLAGLLTPYVGRIRAIGLTQRMLDQLVARPRAMGTWLKGREDYAFPESWHLIRDGIASPDIMHYHNLHPAYFDLRALEYYSQKIPVVVTLHDEWLFTGHCAFSLGCEQWRRGCGDCPQLDSYPAVELDATAENWNAKSAALRNARLFVVAPSQWLLDRALNSMLAPAIIGSKVINNGIDLTVFQPGPKNRAREHLQLDQNLFILLIAANGLTKNVYKDWQTLEKMAQHLGQRAAGKNVLILALGETGAAKRYGNCEIRFIGKVQRREQMVRYYQATDLYVHAARSENYPTVIIEALACGTPVVATDVGGIAEQIHSVELEGLPRIPNRAEDKKPNGFLVPELDWEGMAAAIHQFIERPQLLATLAENVAASDKGRYDVKRQTDKYSQFYRDAIQLYAAASGGRLRVGQRFAAGDRDQPEVPAARTTSAVLSSPTSPQAPRSGKLCVLQVSSSDGAGGAERIARALYQQLRAYGADSWLAVGKKKSEDDGILKIERPGSLNAREVIGSTTSDLLSHLVGQVRGAGLVQRLIEQVIRQPQGMENWLRGKEDYDYPATWRLLALPPKRPHILHCHNLHSGFFDLRALPWLSGQLPVLLTLHDAWLMSGHCAHSVCCEKWTTGCGQCPDLTLYPPVLRDDTANNWARKKRIFELSRLFVCTPSEWLMRKARQSVLQPAILDARVIPNGIDLEVFQTGAREEARAQLQLPQNAVILLFAASGFRYSSYKDFATIRQAMQILSLGKLSAPVIMLAMGDHGKTEVFGQCRIEFLGHTNDRGLTAKYYQAADIYVHSALEETFPTTILEAMACGLPVVATAVGGITEQVRPLPLRNDPAAETAARPHDQPTGLLTALRDPESMANALGYLIANRDLRQVLGRNAECLAREKYDMTKQTKAYMGFYAEMIERWSASRGQVDR